MKNHLSTLAFVLMVAGCSQQPSQKPVATEKVYSSNIYTSGAQSMSAKFEQPTYTATVDKTWDGTQSDNDGKPVDGFSVIHFSVAEGYSDSVGSLGTFSVIQNGVNVAGRITSPFGNFDFELPKSDGTKGLYFHGKLGSSEKRDILFQGKNIGSVFVKYKKSRIDPNDLGYKVELRFNKTPLDISGFIIQQPDLFNTDTLFQFDSSGVGTFMQYSFQKPDPNGNNMLVTVQRR